MKKLLNILMITVFLLSTILSFSGCKKEESEWWEDRSKLNIYFEAEDGTPDKLTVNLADTEVLSNVSFTFQYDGYDHIPSAQIIVDEKIVG